MHATQQINGGTVTTLTLNEQTQSIPEPNENLTNDLDGNLLTDSRWTYTSDPADRLVKMVSLAFTQPAAGAVPARQVKGLTVEFEYDSYSRRIGKKVSERVPQNPLRKILWQGGPGWYTHGCSKFTMNQAETPYHRPNSAVRNLCLHAVHHSSLKFQPPSAPLSPQTPSLPVPRPANDATREK